MVRPPVRAVRESPHTSADNESGSLLLRAVFTAWLDAPVSLNWVVAQGWPAKEINNSKQSEKLSLEIESTAECTATL